jgi:hypothetical protein
MASRAHIVGTTSGTEPHCEETWQTSLLVQTKHCAKSTGEHDVRLLCFPLHCTQHRAVSVTQYTGKHCNLGTCASTHKSRRLQPFLRTAAGSSATCRAQHLPKTFRWMHTRSAAGSEKSSATVEKNVYTRTLKTVSWYIWCPLVMNHAELCRTSAPGHFTAAAAQQGCPVNLALIRLEWHAA